MTIYIDYEKLLRGETDGAVADGPGPGRMHLGTALLYALYPGVAIGDAAGRALADLISPRTPAASDEDVKNIEKLIETGRKQGVDEMEIRVSKERAIGLKGKLDAGKAGDVTIGLDAESEVVIKVKYRP